MFWSDKTILVTGGCSFIGSHLVSHLLDKGARHIRIVDDLSTGKLSNVAHMMDFIEFHEKDLLEPGTARDVMQGVDVVFHLAAIHGGRGYIDLNQANCARNLTLDGTVIHEAYRAGVEKFVYTSSGCVYPVDLQSDVNKAVYLSEDMVGSPYNADGLYGWAKLMGEMTLQAYYHDYGFKSASCRLFTAYGEQCLESHAVIAMIGRAFLKLNPFEVWGNGQQIRNWTYVGDIVRGLVLAAEKIDDATAINLGTEEPIRVLEAVKMIFEYTGHEADIKLRTDMPTGPLNRVASNQLARERLGWVPEVRFADGLRQTIDWYFASKEHEREALQQNFERMLLTR